ncbi:hypothetical protein ACFFF7_10525 [Novosphingobium aquiterrae]|uniref:Uncharacterized protein n=1 Tax=Novosphingobium aquiterrae TaxID=624388 RepID=A0ABV6PJ36_9SPHN
MTTITLDGLSEEEFRRSIEMRLRHDLAGAALERLRALIAPFAQPGGILPERFLTVSASELNLYGWDGLGDALRRHDRPGRPVSALSIAFGWAGEDAPQPDAEGRLTPLIETGYYTDDAFPFSASGREDLLDGYSFHGCTWADDCEARDNLLSLGGIDDLHGALTLLEARLLASDEPDADEIRAGSLGACVLSVLLHQAVSERIARDGLPRPLCVMAGSNGVYPYFDAPVVGLPDDVRKAAEAAEEEEVVDRGVPGPRYSSLLVTGIPRAKKRAVLVLEESEEEMAVRIANLRGIHHREEPPVIAPPASEPEQPALHEPETAIIPIPNGPLLTKKAPGHAWDFRDMLGPPRDAEAPDDAGIPPEDLPSADFPPEDLPPEKPPVADLPFEASARDVFAPNDAVPDLASPEIAPVPVPAAPPLAELPFEIARLEDAAPQDEPVPAEDDFPPPPPLADLPLPPRAPEPVSSEPQPRPRFPSQAPVGPGFALLEPSLQDRLESLLAPHVPEVRPIEREPEPVAATDPAESDLGPIWPLGIGWLEDEAPSANHELDGDIAVERPGLWARLRAWLGRR